MKILFASILLGFLGVCCLAQRPAASPEASALVVIAKKWHSEMRNPALDGDPIGDADSSLEEVRERRMADLRNEKSSGLGPVGELPPPKIVKPETPGRNPSITYIYEVKLRNDGKMDIAAVTWEYVFQDPDSGREVGRRKFESRIPIGAGKTKNLSVQSAIPPTGTITAVEAGNKTPKPDRYTEKVAILSVEYSDGSKWPAPPH
jgi:hypothetical protein